MRRYLVASRWSDRLRSIREGIQPFKPFDEKLIFTDDAASTSAYTWRRFFPLLEISAC